MRVLEYEGKALLRGHGVPVPRGWLLADLPDDVPPDLVVKAQTFGGARGKRGGVRVVEGRQEALGAAAAVGQRLPDGEVVHDFLIEERIAAEAELYAAALVDRDRATTRVLVGEVGGVDVEAAAPAALHDAALDPTLPLRGQIAAVVANLPLGASVRTRLADVLVRLHRALVEEDAELVEVNPLFLLRDSSLVAGDARLVLDADAAVRHPERSLRSTAIEGSDFERAAAALGVVGIEMGGEIAFFSNGAGLTMATLDQLLVGGGRVAAMVELHGVIAYGPERLTAVIELLLGFRPRVLLVNLFYQFRSTRAIAEGLAALLDRLGPARGFDVVARIRAGDADASAELLAKRGVRVVGGFEEACALTLACASARS